jgi:hypothetical protein
LAFVSTVYRIVYTVYRRLQLDTENPEPGDAEDRPGASVVQRLQASTHLAYQKQLTVCQRL